MSLDQRLLEVLACPEDKGPLWYFEDEEITYRELINGANQYSHWFLDNGLQKGDVVALLMENRPEFLMAWIGIAQVGGTTALINTNLTGHPLNHSLSISGASKVILGKEDWI